MKQELSFFPSPEPPTLLERLQGAVQYLFCKGSVTHLTLPSTKLETTSGVSLDVSEQLHLVWMNCSNGNKRCQRCPRFQAYWQGIRQHQSLNQHVDGQVIVALKAQTDPVNGDCEPAQVPDCDAHTRCTVS